ncbi:MAG: ABC-F family ATP-binding cassette domain-containing protein [Bacteroidales bacterium]|nr:ABC-F family ATP-binding cassette domain-containing protein [Bacteroidales bacterium]
MISVDNISVSFGGNELFSGISFLINPRDRIGLTGKNGAGKTTLLRIIHGIMKPAGGKISTSSGESTGYLPQQMKVSDRRSIMEETLTAFSDIKEMERKISRVTSEIERREDYHSEEYMDLCNSLTDLQQEYSMKGGDRYIAEAEQALTGLGFEREQFNKPSSILSGGWRMRIELAKILLAQPTLLLLDEPTNHLDIVSMQWLEAYLKSYPGAVIVVSHDRAFLDNVTNRTVELSLGSIYDYKVPYSEYVILRKERKEQQMAAYTNQRKMIQDNEKFIERFRYKSTKAVQVQSRIKKLDKLDRVEMDEEDSSSISVSFAPAPRSGTIVIEAEGLSKSYGDNEVLRDIDFMLERKEKIAFVGRNGEGKTTFSRIIKGELDYNGKLKRGHNLNIGYFAQNQDQLLDESLTVFQTIDNIARGEIRTKIRNILGAFLFSGEDTDKKVKVLSGGERSRLALIKLLLEPYNLLILDEPTNHLDMQSRDVLKQALQRYDGTLIVVSHDRDFLNNLADKIYEFRAKKIREYNGGIYDFLKKRKIENLRSIERKDNEQNITGAGAASDNKMQYLQKKEDEKLLRKKRKQLSETEKKIEELEKARDEMDNKMGSEPDAISDPDFFGEYEKINKMIRAEMKNWESLSMEIERFKEKTEANG